MKSEEEGARIPAVQLETFAKLFERSLVFVYHCFDRIVIQGYLPLLTRPEHIVHFFRDVHGQYPITPQVLAKRTLEYRGWVEGYDRNHKIPMLKAEKGVSKGSFLSARTIRWAGAKLSSPGTERPTFRIGIGNLFKHIASDRNSLHLFD